MYGQTNANDAQGVATLENALAVTSGSDTQTYGDISWRKSGNVVTVAIHGRNNSTIGTWLDLGVLPVGCRPPIMVRCVGYNNGANASTAGQALEELIIRNSNGYVQWWPFFENHECYSSITFIVED